MEFTWVIGLVYDNISSYGNETVLIPERDYIQK